MTLKERELHNAYDPYNREALYCLRVDILLVLGLVIAFTLFGGWNYPQLYWVFPFYFLLELIFNYSLAILGFFERKLGLFLQKKIKIVRITEDHSPLRPLGQYNPQAVPEATECELEQADMHRRRWKKAPPAPHHSLPPGGSWLR